MHNQPHNAFLTDTRWYTLFDEWYIDHLHERRRGSTGRLPRGQKVSHHRWIWGIHCTQAMNHASEGIYLGLETEDWLQQKSQILYVILILLIILYITICRDPHQMGFSLNSKEIKWMHSSRIHTARSSPWQRPAPCTETPLYTDPLDREPPTWTETPCLDRQTPVKTLPSQIS